VTTDEAIVEAQLRRPRRAEVKVARRCSMGLPVVVVVPPVLDGGEPFPTRYWLSCPLLHRRVAAIEAGGGVQEAQRWCADDPLRQAALEAAHARYARERDAAMPADASLRPSGGVGGTARGVKCLHAHLADHLAGNDNPVGAWVAERAGAAECRSPCVAVREDGTATRSPDWHPAAP
jgi:uncharacterized protein